ncbi:MAG: hypothetical protein IJM46_01050 [Oscillospiraceae bacterium]|nr:hypothetical protein [Oscillospiraceae bacterium]
MDVKSFKCPNCGASLQIPEGTDRFFCTYCGSQIQVDDGKITIDLNANINIDQRYTDVARLKELQLHEKEQERQEAKQKQQRRWKLYWILVLLISIIVYVLCMVVARKNENILRQITSKAAAFIAFFLPFFLLIALPKDWKSSFKITYQTGCAGLITKSILLMIVLLFWACFIIIPWTIGI